MAELEDLTNQKFGKLTVLKFSRLDKHSKQRWICRCDCGITKEFVLSRVKTGHTRSCGCLRGTTKTHGLSQSRIRSIWKGIIQRCNNSNNPNYHRYGGRGVTVCDEWLELTTFVNWAYNNGYSESLQIDRIDNDGGYEPNNCRWVSRKQNCRNTRKNHLITYQGQTRTLAYWCDKFNLDPSLVRYRLKLKWPMHLVFSNKKFNNQRNVRHENNS